MRHIWLLTVRHLLLHTDVKTDHAEMKPRNRERLLSESVRGEGSVYMSSVVCMQCQQHAGVH